jgi:hypothetical protein
MSASWIVLLVPVAMFLFLLSIPILETLVTSRRSLRLSCPEGKGDVDITLAVKESLGISRAVDVCTCSAIADMRASPCRKQCLKSPEAKTGPLFTEAMSA